MRSCSKCGAKLPLQQGRGRRRTMCEACSPTRDRGKPRAAKVAAVVPIESAVKPRSVLASVTDELTKVGMLDSHQGQLALVLAGRIEQGDDTGAALSQMVRQLRETMASALASAEPEAVDPLDELRAKRERRGS